MLLCLVFAGSVTNSRESSNHTIVSKYYEVTSQPVCLTLVQYITLTTDSAYLLINQQFITIANRTNYH